MFEITPQDIAQLNDTDLRTLVGLLCEVELRKRGFSVAAATWGGDQNAKDGGLDVRVNLSSSDAIGGFIPKPSTGFQVKKQDMPPRSIIAEMRPNGQLRPSIRQLAESDGAYIIVSSEGSTSDSALANRKKAMADATQDIPDRLTLDFYDRTRLATWVRTYAGLVIWARQKVGRAIHGWEPFGAWAYPAEGTEAEYLLENGARMRARPNQSDIDLSAESGLNKIRDALRVRRGVVRLVGLSGVGKTRFVQALFDNRIGTNALDPALAVYANMNNDPNPQPFGLASNLIANDMPAILVIDNCAPDLHANLSALARTPASSLSVLTVEYDVSDDQPEGTEVYEIEAASTDLIAKLLQKRFPSLSQVDARTAAGFSGGNARIAIALADTVSRGGTLASLSDTELFNRLFAQRQGHDKSLLTTAQACALVYSFNGEDLSEDGELIQIANLAGLTIDQVYRDVAELLRRDLAQRRGKWRAILPHALANRLATTALQDIPLQRIQKSVINGAHERLTKSFSRRLGYLDNSREASAIVSDWLAPTGWIGSTIWNLNEYGKTLLRNCLPASPEAGLRALELKLPTHDKNTPITTGDYVPRQLRSLAWNAAFFERSIAMLEILAIYGEGRTAKEAIEIHASLFQLYLSGTHATVEQRATAVRRLLASANSNEQSLGLSALASMLNSTHFSSNYDFEFGAHSRDYGYRPKTYAERNHWHKTALAIAENIALSDHPAAEATQSKISSNFRGLWTSVALRDELESISIKLARKGFWRDGWLAIKLTRFYDEKDKKSDNYARLSMLEEILRPQNLVQRVRGRVLSSNGGTYVDYLAPDNADSYRSAMEKQRAEAKALGNEVATDPAALQELMPEIVGGAGNLWDFGVGLASGAKNLKTLWHHMLQYFERTPLESRDTRAFRGMLFELRIRESNLLNELLDEALENEPLAPYFPTLQASASIDMRGMTRLLRSIELGKAPISTYTDVHLGNAIEVVPAADIAKYVLTLAKAPDGENIAVSTICTLFFCYHQGKRPYPSEIIAAGRELLQQTKFDRRDQREEYQVSELAEICLIGDGGHRAAEAMCRNLKTAVAENKTYGFNHTRLIKTLFRVQPQAALNAFLTGDDAIVTSIDAFDHADNEQTNPLDEVSETALLEWCSEDPDIRYSAAAMVASVFAISATQEPSWYPLASRLVHGAPDPIEVMRRLIERLRPMTWSGSKATILEKGRVLLDRFDTRHNLILADLIEMEKAKLQKEAHNYFEWETKHDRDRDERFE